MTDVDGVHTELRALRNRLNKLEARQVARDTETRTAALATMLAGAMLVLTAVSWVVDPGDENEPYTLWGLVPELGWTALVTLALVWVFGVGSALLFVGDPGSRAVHTAFVFLGIVTAISALVVGNVEDADTAPGRWLTLLAALALAGLHGARAGELRDPARP